MRNVDHHAQTIHFHDHVAPEWAQPIPLLRTRIRRIGDAVVGAVGEGDVAHAAIEEERQLAQVAADRGAVLHAHRQQDATTATQPIDVAW